TLGGIRDMQRTPSAVWIIDTKKEHIAVGEARKLNIPVVAILDTNCDPDEVDFPIPGNDDAIRSATLLTRVIADAVAEGLMQRAAANSNAGRGEDKPNVDGQLATDEPLADWELELLKTGQQADAAPAETAAPEAPAADAPAEAPADAPAAEATPAEATPADAGEASAASAASAAGDATPSA
ncbi:MAG TPA: 30S ribosomal protein S2, partial [Mycobacteriales bacterium]|nr:30S ribosomal protein S2 [Mycobacteriales bacterium]